MKKIATIPCFNPKCDEIEGCCLCEHTGWIQVFEEENIKHQQIKGNILIEFDESDELLNDIIYQ